MRSNLKDIRRAGWLSGEALTAYGVGAFLFCLGIVLAGLLRVLSWHTLVLAFLIAFLVGFWVRKRIRKTKTIPRGYALLVPQEKDTDVTSLSVGMVLILGMFLIVACYAFDAAAALLAGTVLSLMVLFRNYLYLQSNLEQAAALIFLIPAVMWLFAPLGATPIDSFGLSGLVASAYMVLIGRLHNKKYSIAASGGVDSQVVEEALDSEDVSRKVSALTYLISRPDASLLDRVVELSLSNDKDLAFMAQYALAGFWGGGPLLAQQAKDGQMQETLEKLPSRMRERLEDEIFLEQQAGRRHQKAVEEELGRLAPADRSFLGRLISLADGVGSQFKEAQLVAIEMLGPTNSGAAYASLVRHLLSEDKEVAAAAMVGFYGASLSVLEILEAVLKSPVGWMRKRGIQATYYYLDYLRWNKPSDCSQAYSILSPVASELLANRNSVTRAYALYLVDSSIEEGVNVLKQAFKDASAFVRSEALVHLTALAPEDARECVRAGLEDARALVRVTALSCAAELRMSELRGEFRRLAEQDPILRVSRAAQTVFMESGRWIDG